MKILDARAIKSADQLTIESQKITAIDLMERAAQACVNELISVYDKSTPFAVFIGSGNNGGDGLAIARLLYDSLYDVKVYLCVERDRLSTDAQFNLTRIGRRAIGIVESIPPQFLAVDDEAVIIDGLLGIGINESARAPLSDYIDKINSLTNEVISIDIPSGMTPEGVQPEDSKIIKADWTLTFQAPKLNLLLANTGNYVGTLSVLDIRLDLSATDSSYEYIHDIEAYDLYQCRHRFTHKGSYGHALIIGGAIGKMGSVILSSRAAIRAGAGLVSAYLPACGLDAMQIANPEIMCIQDIGERTIHDIKIETDYSVYGIGIGIGTGVETSSTVLDFLEEYSHQSVVDADALNIVSRDAQDHKRYLKGSVITPHVKEFERLAGSWKDDYEKLDKIKSYAIDNECVVVFKDAVTIIADVDGRLYFNSTGNPGMATAGSGDVLLGMITGLISQGYRLLDAALFGVYLHGLAGDLYVDAHGEESLIASDIIAHIGAAFRTFE